MRAVSNCHRLVCSSLGETLLPVCRQVSSAEQSPGFPESCVQRCTELRPLLAKGQWSFRHCHGTSTAARMFCREDTQGKPRPGPREPIGSYASHFILRLVGWLCGSFLLTDSFSVPVVWSLECTCLGWCAQGAGQMYC